MSGQIKAQIIIRPEEVVTLMDGSRAAFLLKSVDRVISRQLITTSTDVSKIGFAEAVAPQEQYYTLTQAFNLQSPIELVFLGMECDGSYLEASFDGGTTPHLRDDRESEPPILIIQVAPGMTTDEIALRAPANASVKILYQRV